MEGHHPPHHAPETLEAGAALPSTGADRRQFIVGTLAGTVAAAALAVAAPDDAAADSLQARAPRKPPIGVDVTFSTQTQPTLDDVMNGLKAILTPVGCPTCGLLGIELLLKMDPVVVPPGAPVPAVVASLVGSIRGF
jgi:hypothetical protein